MNKNKTLSIVNTNIFTNPQYMKTWGKEMNIPPDMGKLRWLMEKFVKDYNVQLGELGEEE